MAILKYGAIVTEIKGKVGGQVFQGGRSGSILKNKGSQKKRSCGKVELGDLPCEGLTQNNFGRVTKEWSRITQAERDTWLGLVGVWTFTNKFGDVYNGTAFQIFTAVNINRLTLELTMLASAPIKVDANDTGMTLSDYSLAGSWDLTTTDAAVPTQLAVASVSYPQTLTKNASSVTVRKVAVLPILGAGTTDAKPLYLAFYGGEPPLGSKIITTIWVCVSSYPRQQFFSTFESEVVA